MPAVRQGKDSCVKSTMISAVRSPPSAELSFLLVLLLLLPSVALKTSVLSWSIKNPCKYMSCGSGLGEGEIKVQIRAVAVQSGS